MLCKIKEEEEWPICVSVGKVGKQEKDILSCQKTWLLCALELAEQEQPTLEVQYSLYAPIYGEEREKGALAG